MTPAAILLAAIGATLPAAPSQVQAMAMIAAATPEVPAELLASIAYRESRFDNRAWRRGRHGGFICGATQVHVRTWVQCQSMRDPFVAYAAAVANLRGWRHRCRRHRDVTECSLAAYGAGHAGLARGTSRYARRVLARARRLRVEVLRLTPSLRTGDRS